MFALLVVQSSATFATNRAFNSSDVLQSLAINVIFVLQPFDLLLQHHAPPLRFQIFTRRLQESPVRQIKSLADRQRDLLRQFIANENEARVPLRILLLRDEAEELLLPLVIGTVRYSVQRVLMHDSLKTHSQLNIKTYSALYHWK